MADFKAGQGTKTHRDNDHVTRIADGQSGATATDFLTIAQPDDAIVGDTNDYGVPLLVCDENGDYQIFKQNSTGVVVTQGEPVKNCSYFVHVDVADAATSDHDATIADTKIVRKISVSVSSMGCGSYEVGTWDGATFTPYATLITQPASPTANCDVCIPDFTGNAGGTNEIRIHVIGADDTTDFHTSMAFCENDA